MLDISSVRLGGLPYMRDANQRHVEAARHRAFFESAGDACSSIHRRDGTLVLTIGI